MKPNLQIMQKAEEYSPSKLIESLELMSFMISHKLRGPLCSIMAAVPILNDTSVRIIDKNLCLDLVCQSAAKIDLFTKELSRFIESTRSNLIADQSKILKLDGILVHV